MTRFQAGEADAFVISLRAGGTGINLTRATHVVHYDRWWNPAVEDQASDRAWRIGQTRPVEVHRLVCEGTVEDRIATLLATKRDLADAVVGAGEAWISELGRRRAGRAGRSCRSVGRPDGRAAGVRHHVVGEGVDRRARAPGPPRRQPPAPGPDLRPPRPGPATSSSARARSTPGCRAAGPSRTRSGSTSAGSATTSGTSCSTPSRPGRPTPPPCSTASWIPGIVEDARAVGRRAAAHRRRGACPAAPVPTGRSPASTPRPSATSWPTSSTPIPSPSSASGAGPGRRS